MREVLEYIYSVAVISAIGGAACAFMSFGSEKTEKFGRYVLSLVVLLLLISPMLNFFKSSEILNGDEIKKVTDQLIREYESKSSDTRNFVISDGIENVEKRISEAVGRRYSVPVEEIESVIETYDDGESVHITQIKIVLGMGAYSLDADEVKEYVSTLCGVNCEVSFK